MEGWFDIAVLMASLAVAVSGQHLTQPYVFGSQHHAPPVSHAFTPGSHKSYGHSQSSYGGSGPPAAEETSPYETSPETSSKPKRYVLVPKSPHYGSEPMILNHMEVADLPKVGWSILQLHTFQWQ